MFRYDKIPLALTLNEWMCVRTLLCSNISNVSYFPDIDKLLKKGEAALKSTINTAASVADKTATVVAGAAGTTVQTTSSVIDGTSKLAKNTAEKTTTAAGQAWQGIVHNITLVQFPSKQNGDRTARTRLACKCKQLLPLISFFSIFFSETISLCI